MDLNFTPEEEAFRSEVRAFLAAKLPVRLSEKVRSGKILEKADMQEWHAILNERGWLANHWPEQYGGPGWTAVEKFIFENECALAFAPRIVPFGVNMLGPVLIKYGSPAQQAHYLPRILDGSDWWCQGFSEPGAGSDLAGVATTALALHNAFLPPTINHTDPDPDCDIDVIPNVGRAVEVEAALCNCLGFGSKNSALVLGRV